METPLKPLPAFPAQIDLDAMQTGLSHLWGELSGRRVFISGGTGFIGRWLLAALIDADERRKLNVQVTVLTRNAAAFRHSAPRFAAARCVSLIQGDVRDIVLPSVAFDYVIHAATDVAAESAPIDVFDTCVLGTRRVLDLTLQSGAARFLLVSSGAVYGRQPAQLAAMPESFLGGPDPLAAGSVYGESKRAAECLASVYARNHGLHIGIARCFAFVGPYLPLDKQFAIGNFIRAAMSAIPIEIQGDGTPLRSYLYASDLAIWLWSILLRGRSGAAYNVGGNVPISIEALAKKTVQLLSIGLPIRIARQASAGQPVERYVPDITLARVELGLKPQVTLDEAILRTADWHRLGKH